jgi:hypothetical protein
MEGDPLGNSKAGTSKSAMNPQGISSLIALFIIDFVFQILKL